jgi:hypothetical protein
MKPECEHKTSVQIAARGPYTIERCEWGCGGVLFSRTDANGITKTAVVADDLRPFVEILIEAARATDALRTDLADCQQYLFDAKQVIVDQARRLDSLKARLTECQQRGMKTDDASE